MKTGLVLRWLLENGNRPRRPSHGWQYSTFGGATQDAFAGVSKCASGPPGVGAVDAGRRLVVPPDRRIGAGKSDADPCREAGLRRRRPRPLVGNGGTTLHRGLLVDRGRAMVAASYAAGLRLLSQPLVVR